MEKDRTSIIELKSIAKGSSVFFLGSLFGLGINLIYNWYIARLMGAEGIGLVSIILSVTTIITFVAMFGLRRTLVRFIASYQAEHDYERINGTILSSLIFISILSWLLAIGLYVLRAFIVEHVFHDPELLIPFSIVVFCIPFASLTTIISFIAQAFKKAGHQTVIINIVAPLSRLGLTVLIFWLLDPSPENAAFGILGANIFSTIFSLGSLNKIYPFRNFIQHKPKFVLVKLVLDSWPLLFMELIIQTKGQLGILMLGILSSSSEVGIYKISVRVTVFIRLFFKALNTMFAPVISDAYYKKDKDLLEKLLKSVTRWGFISGWIIFLVLVIFSREILAFFGPEFIGGVSVLRIMAVSHLVLVFVGPLDTLITMIGRSKLNLVNSLALGTVTISMHYLLIPQLGSVGAAIATTAGLLVFDLLHVIQVRSILKLFSIDWKVYKPILAGILSTGFILLVRQFVPSWNDSIWIVMVLSAFMGLFYLLCLYVLGLEDTDQEIIQVVLRRIGVYKVKE